MMSLLSRVLGQCSPERRQRKCHYGAEMQAVLQGELHWYVLRNLRGITHFTHFLLRFFLSPFLLEAVCKEHPLGIFFLLHWWLHSEQVYPYHHAHEGDSKACRWVQVSAWTKLVSIMSFYKSFFFFFFCIDMVTKCKLLRRSEKNWILPFEGQLQELLGYFV